MCTSGSVMVNNLTSKHSRMSSSLIRCPIHSVLFLFWAKRSVNYNYLAIGRKIGASIPFPRLLTLCEMQKALSKIWTMVTITVIVITPWVPFKWSRVSFVNFMDMEDRLEECSLPIILRLNTVPFWIKRSRWSFLDF